LKACEASALNLESTIWDSILHSGGNVVVTPAAKAKKTRLLDLISVERHGVDGPAEQSWRWARQSAESIFRGTELYKASQAFKLSVVYWSYGVYVINS